MLSFVYWLILIEAHQWSIIQSYAGPQARLNCMMEETRRNGAVPPVTDEKALLAYGAAKGLRPRSGESWHQFRSRIAAHA